MYRNRPSVTLWTLLRPRSGCTNNSCLVLHQWATMYVETILSWFNIKICPQRVFVLKKNFFFNFYYRPRRMFKIVHRCRRKKYPNGPIPIQLHPPKSRQRMKTNRFACPFTRTLERSRKRKVGAIEIILLVVDLYNDG